MAKKRKLSTTEKEYKKQRRRITREIKIAEARGYSIDYRVLPAVPKRITKASVARLAKITPKVLYSKATYLAPDNNIMSGEEGRKFERQQAAKKAAIHRKANQLRGIPKVDTSGITKPGKPPAIVDTVLSAVEDLIARFPMGSDWQDWQYKLHEKHKNMLEGMLNTQIMLASRTVVAMRLQRSTEDIVQLVERIIYGDSKDEAFQTDIIWFAQILKGDNLTAEEAIAIQDLANEYEA